MKFRPIAFLIAWHTCLAAWLPAAELPGRLKAETVPNALGLTLHEYAFSWTAEGQQSYRILVAGDAARLAAGVGDLWDSGRRYSEKSTKVLCRGRAFPAGGEVWWKVQVWGADGAASAFSEPARLAISDAAANAKPQPRPTHWQGEKREFMDGRVGRALRFGKDRARVYCEDYEELRSRQGTTIAAWVRPENPTEAWQCIYRKEDGLNRRILALGNESKGASWGLWCGLNIGGYREIGGKIDPARLTDGAWHHVAVSYDGRAVRLFLDGKKIAEEKISGALGAGGASPAFLGSAEGIEEFFEGGLDEVRVYRQGLSEAAIAKLAGGGDEVEKGDLVGHWKLDDTIENEAKFVPALPVRNRVAFLGDSLISRMDKFGYLETSVTANWPQHHITFRNLGWPADDVFGTARAEFKDDRNTRGWESGRPGGVGHKILLQQVADAKASTIMIGYGSSVAFPEAGLTLDQFESGYADLANTLASQGATLILLTPPKQEATGSPVRDLADRNRRLQATADFIIAFGKKNGHRVIDVHRKLTAPKGEAITENGLHLNDLGYRRLAALLARELGLQKRAQFSVAADLGDGRVFSHGGATIGDPVTTERGMRFDVHGDQLPSRWMHPLRKLRIPGAPHTYRLRIDGGTVLESPAAGWASGQTVALGPEFDHTERLRATIIDKNLQHRRRLRPLNKTYIFLFRAHEMGHLAYEMGDFDRLVGADEERIATLRVPHTHRYAIERIDPWKPVHNDPEEEVPRIIPQPDVAAELAGMTVPEGFELNLFASDPVLTNPINLNWDTRGRAWVSMSSTYPHIKPGREPNDRIVILEDKDQDGVAEKSTVFADGLLVPHSVMPVEGGAYVCSATEFLFLADTDGDDRADQRRVVFSGFGNADVHHMIHALRWAPWGELYFNQSIYINSFIETRWGKRRLNGSGVWRFRPESESLDVFARGAVNPWGHTFDRWGQSFITDGAAGGGPHYTFAGAAFRSAVGAPRTMNALVPGKPNGTGCEILSGRHFPEEWLGSIVENDFRANRTVRYKLTETGSGFAAEEVETLVRSNRQTYRPVDLKVGPEGALYIVDWYNAIIDHGEVDFHHPRRDKSHGRIWRLKAKDRPLVERPAIRGAPVGALLDYLKAPEDFTRTQARRELATRPAKEVLAKLAAWVKGLARDDPDFEHHRLEALWTSATMKAPNEALLRQVLASPEPRARAGAVRIVFHWRGVLEDPLKLLAAAVDDEQPRVRLEAVNALRETGGLEAATIAFGALRRPVDKWLDYAIWLTARELRDDWLPALQTGKMVFGGPPDHLRYVLEAAGDARAVEALRALWPKGEIAPADRPNAIATIASLGSADDLQFALAAAGAQPSLLEAVAAGARFNPAKPEKSAASTAVLLTNLEHRERSVREAAAELLGLWNFGGNSALARRVRTARDAPERLVAAKALARLGDYKSLAALATPKQRDGVRIAAIAAWAGAQPGDATQAAVALLTGAGDPESVAPVFVAFIDRESGAALLAEALKGVELKEAVAVAGIRLARGAGRDVSELVTALSVAGSLQPVPFDLPQSERKALLAEVSRTGDTARGFEVYRRKSLACTICHQIGTEGGKVGPDLTSLGAYAQPAAILDSILSPNRDIKQGFETILVTRKDNTVVAGILQRRSDTATIVRDPAGNIIAIPNDAIQKTEKSPVSLMPPGLTGTLRKDELVDLMRFMTELGKAPE